MKSILKFSLLPLFLLALTGHAALTVTNIASGNYAYHSLFIKSDGSLWVMGYNNAGQLGSGNLIRTNRPEQIVAGGVTAIAAGGYHSLFLKSDTSLWAMGQNNFGQLGDGRLSNTNKPEQITNGVVAIAAGGNSGVALSGGGQSLFIKSDGSLWAMGNNNGGQLGDGTFNSTNRPEQIVASGAATDPPKSPCCQCPSLKLELPVLIHLCLPPLWRLELFRRRFPARDHLHALPAPVAHPQ